MKKKKSDKKFLCFEVLSRETQFYRSVRLSHRRRVKSFFSNSACRSTQQNCVLGFPFCFFQMKIAAVSNRTLIDSHFVWVSQVGGDFFILTLIGALNFFARVNEILIEWFPIPFNCCKNRLCEAVKSTHKPSTSSKFSTSCKINFLITCRWRQLQTIGAWNLVTVQWDHVLGCC